MAKKKFKLTEVQKYRLNEARRDLDELADDIHGDVGADLAGEAADWMKKLDTAVQATQAADATLANGAPAGAAPDSDTDDDE